ncbi:hypothetical protein C5B91_08645 [Haloferax sp. Atlit-10N]|uniref:hypothetical protein n=1 Tax=Haloferax TaxID=2251 RepID=UPI0006779AC3|nr:MULTISPECIES: hypothetical protein [Haloferax]RDZ44942.1 hypothetical protein C5B87_12325 [Haloferax sp. Atlit-16N]RDZ48294.1 hypothetical protein C5B86_04390 [Haloferax sp. Atlit-19N]RDZ59281.1 hypothetical protein C5B91_08645 [Haloferax sp. Atlit-10N]
MPSIVNETVFSEPSGGLFPVVQLCGALVFSGLYWQYAVVEQSLSGGWLLFMIAGTALSGLAESLPKHRRRAAGVLRVAAILVLTCLLAILFLAPELFGL